MENQDNTKLLTEIRDEIRELNSNIMWLKDIATKAMDDDKEKEIIASKALEVESKKSKRDFMGIIILCTGIGAFIILDKLGII